MDKRKKEDEKTRALLQDYLAQLDAERPAAEPFEDRVMRRRGDGKIDVLHAYDKDGRKGVKEGVYDDEILSTLKGSGHRWVDANSYDATRRRGAPVQPPPGKVPFYLSNEEGHRATPAPNPLAEPMAKAAEMGRGFPAEPRVEVNMRPPEIVSRKGPEPRALRLPSPGRVDPSSALRSARDAARGPRLPAERGTGVDPEVEAYVMASDDDLEAAQGQAAAGANRARLARALSMINESISGARYDRDAYDALERDSDRPVRDLLARRGEARTEEDRRQRADDFQRRWAADDRDFKYRQDRDATEDDLARQRIEADERARSAEARQRAALLRESRADRLLRQQQAEEERNQRHQDRLEQKRKEEMADKQAELGKRVGATGEVASDIRTINSAIEKGGDIPGIGVWDSWKLQSQSLPARAARAMFASQEDFDVSQAVNRLSGNENRAMTGLASSDSEREENKRRRGLDAGNTEEGAVRGLQTLARDAKQKLRQVEGAFGEEVVDEYARRGAQTSRDVPDPAVRPTGRVKRLRNGEVWAEMDDGTARRIR